MEQRFSSRLRTSRMSLLHQTRRHFFKQCAVGLGSFALADLLARGLPAKERYCAPPTAPCPPHFAPPATDVFNHAPAKIFVNTGPPQWGRPAIGAGVTYGIGSEPRDLPGIVVLQSGPRGPRGGAPLWGNGVLPSAYQGRPVRSAGEPSR